VILGLAVLVQYWRVTDGQTDGWTVPLQSSFGTEHTRPHDHLAKPLVIIIIIIIISVQSAVYQS